MKIKMVRRAIRHVLATAIPPSLGLAVTEAGASVAAAPDLDAETDRILALARQQHHDY